MQVAVRNHEVLVLAAGSTTAAKSNNRGHLFEEFIGNLLHHYGYGKPTRNNLNVTTNGVELDVVACHTVENRTAIAECKAYSSPLPSRELSAFYGKLTSHRFEDPSAVGYFVALPGLTADGRELQKRLESNDRCIHILDAIQIIKLLEEREILPTLATLTVKFGYQGGNFSDVALLICEEGLFLAAKAIDTTTLLAQSVLVYPTTRQSGIPVSVLELLRTHPFGDGMQCRPASTAQPGINDACTLGREPSGRSAPTIVEVTGGSSDFEYQFPTSARYFVGREPEISEGLLLAQLVCNSLSGGRVLVLNAQSGWGKSSYALKLIAEIRSLGGLGICVDSRTAETPSYVSAVLQRALVQAQALDIIRLPEDGSFASLPTSLDTISRAIVVEPTRPICVIFDQFENVFQDFGLTQEFRNLALSVADLRVPLVIAFAWKTDLVAFTEGHPYHLRDDIRSRAKVISLEPMGAKDISRLINRLQKEVGQKIHRDLRERLREYSQGLPWLFKKLGSHMLRELRHGATQERLLLESLNIQGLFEHDLGTLGPIEQQALREIARQAPVMAGDAVELATSPSTLQSLLDKRLLVQIGSRIDVYWDTFRDFLNRGSVPIEESYILRTTPGSVSRLLRVLRDAGGAATVDDVAHELTTSKTSVFNMSRDLRQMGVLTPTQGELRYTEDIAKAAQLELALRSRVGSALRRHKAYALVTTLAQTTGRTSISAFTDGLPSAFPAVQATRATWVTYAAAFAYWMQFGALVGLDRDDIVLGSEQPLPKDFFAERRKRAGRRPAIFPCAPVAEVSKLIAKLQGSALPRSALRGKADSRALMQAERLGLTAHQDTDTISLSPKGLKIAAWDSEELAELLLPLEEFRLAAELLARDPGVSPADLGAEVARLHGLSWKASTTQKAGVWLRAWMRASGVSTNLRKDIKKDK